MEVSQWAVLNWFDLAQTVGIIGSLLVATASLLLTYYTLRKDERARQIANLIAIHEQYRETWQNLYEYPTLARVLTKDATKQHISMQEELFVTTLILHLNAAYRATKLGELIPLQGLRKDVNEFFSLPIPKIIWDRLAPFQDADFVAFVEAALK